MSQDGEDQHDDGADGDTFKDVYDEDEEWGWLWCQVTRTDEDAAREMEELTGAEAGVNGFVLHMAAR